MTDIPFLLIAEDDLDDQLLFRDAIERNSRRGQSPI